MNVVKVKFALTIAFSLRVSVYYGSAPVYEGGLGFLEMIAVLLITVSHPSFSFQRRDQRGFEDRFKNRCRLYPERVQKEKCPTNRRSKYLNKEK